MDFLASSRRWTLLRRNCCANGLFTNKNLMKKFIPISLLLLFVSCFSTNTTNPEKAYKYWTNSEPPKEIELLKGQYYQSSHFFLEYEVFLKFKSNKKWFNEFVTHNKLEIDTVNNNWSRFTELPEWFKPDKNYLIYTVDQNDEFERSRYMMNPENGICYIYETLGM